MSQIILFEPHELTVILKSLPDDGFEATIELSKIVSERLTAIGIDLNSPKIRSEHADVMFTANTLMISYLRKRTGYKIGYEPNMTAMANWQNVGGGVTAAKAVVKELRLKNFQNQTKTEIEKLIDDVQQVKDGETFGFAILNDDDRTRIFSAIEKLRILFEQSDLSPKKKDALLAKLSELHREAAREFTATERFFGFLGDLSFVIGKMAKNAKPAIDEAKDMARIVMNRRGEQEGVALPKPEDLPQLPAPDKNDEN